MYFRHRLNAAMAVTPAALLSACLLAASVQGEDAGKPLVVGIVGYEGHGSVFAEELNAGLGQKIGLQVGYVWNKAPVDPAKVARFHYEIVAQPQDMLGKVDGVLITEELPDRYPELAAPFIRAGVRTFLNRPLAASAREAADLLRLARDCKNPVFSASALSVGPEILAVRDEWRQYAPLKIVNVTGPSNHFWWYVPHALSALVSVLGPGVEEVYAHDFAWEQAAMTISNPLIVFFRYRADAVVGPVRGTVQIVPPTMPEDWYGFRMKLYGHGESPEYTFFKPGSGESAWMPMYRALIAFFRDGESPLSERQLLEVPLVLDMIRRSGEEHRAVTRSEYADVLEGFE